MVSALLGYIGFKLVSNHLKFPFTPAENVLIQTVATATGCMPVTARFTETIPAIEHVLTPKENGPIRLSTVKLLIWSCGLCLFGLIFASLLRDHFVPREKMPWPSTTATAKLIKILHVRGDLKGQNSSYQNELPSEENDTSDCQESGIKFRSKLEKEGSWQGKMGLLAGGAMGSGLLVSGLQCSRTSPPMDRRLA